MFQVAKPLFLICETPLHAGSGSDLGIVDLPIQREKHTSFPKIESSSLKGAIREAFETKLDMPKKGNLPEIDALFGPEGEDAHMGALGFSDARLLLFPVKSMKGVFAWITCPMVLQQFERDMRITDASFKIEGFPSNIKGGEAYRLNKDCQVIINDDDLLLEEYAFKVKDTLELKIDGQNMNLNHWLAYHASKEAFFQDKINDDIILLSNDDFKDFVNLSTEVITRTKINNNTGTVQPGALFTEEFLPAESIMYSLIMAAPIFKSDKNKPAFIDKASDIPEAIQVLNKFSTVIKEKLSIMQIGGNATLGKGIVRTTIL